MKKKFLSISILLLIIINTMYSSYAAQLGTKEVKLIGWCENYFTFKGEPTYVPYVAYEKDGTYMPAYCMNPNNPGVGTDGVNSYNVVTNSKLTNEMVWRVLINSYPYKSLNELGANSIEEAFYATKIAIFTIIDAQNRKPEDYRPVDSDAARRVHRIFLNLINEASSSNEILTNNDKISIVGEKDWNIDGNYLSKTYNISSVIKNGKVNLELSGELPNGSKLVNEKGEERNEFALSEKFKILVPIDKIEEVYEFSLKATSNLKTYPIYYGKSVISGKQDYALVGYTDEILTANLSDKTVTNKTKITILKKEYGSEKKLSGVKFNLLDSNQNIIYENLVSNDAGEVEIQKLLPGKYFVQETETLEGYNLYTDLIEVNLKFNEEVDVVVNNTIKSVNEISKETETIEVIENKSEKSYKNQANQIQVVNNKVKKLPVTGY